MMTGRSGEDRRDFVILQGWTISNYIIPNDHKHSSKWHDCLEERGEWKYLRFAAGFVHNSNAGKRGIPVGVHYVKLLLLL